MARQQGLGYGGRELPVERPYLHHFTVLITTCQRGDLRPSSNGIHIYAVDGVGRFRWRAASGVQGRATPWTCCGPRCARAGPITTMRAGEKRPWKGARHAAISAGSARGHARISGQLPMTGLPMTGSSWHRPALGDGGMRWPRLLHNVSFQRFGEIFTGLVRLLEDLCFGHEVDDGLPLFRPHFVIEA
jgi:hypothetical protein